MTERPPCPGPERLGRLLEPDVGADDLPELTAHLDDCERCQGVLEGLASAGQTLTALRVMAAGEHGAMAGKARPPAIGEALAWLEPSDDPEALGVVDDYRIVGILGQGGMGIVYKAFDPSLHRYVAVKVLAPHLGTGAAARKRFEREARAAAAVNHEHVIAIHAVRERRGLPYLVMECIPGLSLQDLIEHEGPIELRRLLRIGMQIASGLAAAHAQGLVHRDIKPANILLENGIERVKITDFGLARAVDDVGITQSGTVAGTPQYMAPEQAGGEPLDHRADLFSLGSVLYAMCSGEPPFQGDTPLAVIRRVSDREPRPLAELNPDTPDWLVAIIERLHAKRPEDRFQSASEVADLLGQYLAYLQHPSHAPKPKPPAPFKKPRAEDSELGMTPARPRRSRKRIGLAAAAALLIAAMGLSYAPNSAWAKLDNFLATVFRMKTPNGTLAVTVNDPSIKIKVDGEELLIEQPGMNEFRIKPGTYKLVASKDGHLLKQEWITIARDGKTLATVVMEPDRQETPAATAPPLAPETLSATERWYAELIEQWAKAKTPQGPTISDRTRILEELKNYHEVPDPLVAKGYKVPGKGRARSGDRLPPNDQIRAALDLLDELQRNLCKPGWNQAMACLTDPSKRGQDFMHDCRSCHMAPAPEPAQPQSGQPAPSGAGNPPAGATVGGHPPMGGAGLPSAEPSGNKGEDPFDDLIGTPNNRGKAPDRGKIPGQPTSGGQQGPAAGSPTAAPAAKAEAKVLNPPLAAGAPGPNNPVTAMVADPSGRWLYVGMRGGRIAKIEPATGHFTSRDRDFDRAAMFHALAISPDGRLLASATGRPGLGNSDRDAPGKIQIWDADSWEIRHTLELSDCPLAVAFSPNFKKLAAASLSGDVWIWDFPDCKQKITLHHGENPLLRGEESIHPSRKEPGVNALAFSPDGDVLATAGLDGRIGLWWAERGTLIRDAAIFPHAVSRIAFSPDGSRIAATGQSLANSDPAPIALVQTKYLRILAQDTLENAVVSDIRFAPDGRRLIAVGGQSLPEGEGVGLIATWDVISVGLKRIAERQDPSRRWIPAAAVLPKNRGFYVVNESLSGRDDIERIDWPTARMPDPARR